MTEKARPKRIVLDTELQSEIEAHANTRLDAEVGGMLFGRIKGSETTILGFVPALNATAEQISLTFTHEVWEEILREGQQKFPDMTIVGWYHTHPTFGVYLSEYDQFIQRNFFSTKGQLALVIDPVAGQLGWFDLNSKGNVREVNTETTITGSHSVRKREAAIQKHQTGPRVLSTIAISVGALVISSAVTAGILLANIPPDLRGSLANLQVERQSLVQQLDYQETWLAETMKIELIRVGPNQTLDEVIEQRGLDPQVIPDILALNPGVAIEGEIGAPLLFIPMQAELEPTLEPEVPEEPESVSPDGSVQGSTSSPEPMTEVVP